MQSNQFFSVRERCVSTVDDSSERLTSHEAFLRLNGANAKEHPVFRELVRVKQYFEKIKALEGGGSRTSELRLDKEAAGRFIKHSLVTHHISRYCVHER